MERKDSSALKKKDPLLKGVRIDPASHPEAAAYPYEIRSQTSLPPKRSKFYIHPTEKRRRPPNKDQISDILLQFLCDLTRPQDIPVVIADSVLKWTGHNLYRDKDKALAIGRQWSAVAAAYCRRKGPELAARGAEWRASIAVAVGRYAEAKRIRLQFRWQRKRDDFENTGLYLLRRTRAELEKHQPHWRQKYGDLENVVSELTQRARRQLEKLSPKPETLVPAVASPGNMAAEFVNPGQTPPPAIADLRLDDLPRRSESMNLMILRGRDSDVLGLVRDLIQQNPAGPNIVRWHEAMGLEGGDETPAVGTPPVIGAVVYGQPRGAQRDDDKPDAIEAEAGISPLVMERRPEAAARGGDQPLRL